MPSSTEIDKKIALYRVIEDVVTAMKAYAGVMIRKTEELVPDVRKYENNILAALTDIAGDNLHSPHSFPEQKRIIVAFGSSQGLCGSYNEKMAEAVSGLVTADDYLVLIGERLLTSLSPLKASNDCCGISPLSIGGINPALKDTMSRIMAVYGNNGYYNLTIVFTTLFGKKASIAVEQILPPRVEDRQPELIREKNVFTYLDSDTLFLKILEEFLYISLYRCYLEALRSENWYRLNSMENAFETLQDKLSELRTLQNYIRQEEVTEEMIEILGGGMFYK